MHASLIEHLVQVRGIETEYLDAWGKSASVKLESQQKILAAMGYPMDDDEALINMLNTEAETDWFTMVEPASIIKKGQDSVLHFKLPIDFANDELHLTITQNGIIRKKLTFIPIDQELLGAFEVKDMEMQHYALPVNLDLAVGYYQIDLVEPGIEEPLGTGALILTPQTCYQVSPSIMDKTLTIKSISEVQSKCELGIYRELFWGVNDSVFAVNDLNNLEKQTLKQPLYYTGINLGLAPSIEQPLGECLDSAAINPISLYQQAYQPIIDLFRANMHDSDVLNIKNVMALLKHWWVAKGTKAEEGCYVYYPFEDLLAILALESQLSSCSVITDASNTIDDSIKLKLQETGIESYEVTLVN